MDRTSINTRHNNIHLHLPTIGIILNFTSKLQDTLKKLAIMKLNVNGELVLPEDETCLTFSSSIDLSLSESEILSFCFFNEIPSMIIH